MATNSALSMIGRFAKRRSSAVESSEISVPRTRELSRDTDFTSRTYLSDGLQWEDELIQNKGLAIFDEMLNNDAQIANTFHLKRHMGLVNGYDIKPYVEGNKEAERRARFVKWVFSEQLEGSLSTFLLHMWDALRLGYKVAEINWAPIEYGEFAGLIGIKSLKVRRSHNYRFDCDVHGNLRKRGIIEGNNIYAKARALPKDKFVVFTWGALDNDGVSLYGKSEFRAAYRYYKANDFIHVKWLRRLENISDPAPIAEVDPNRPMTDEQRVKLTQDLAKLHKMASFVPPPGVKVGTYQSGFGDVSGGKTSESGFVEALNWNNTMISKALLVGSLVQQEGKVSGSYALGQLHFDALVQCLEQLRRVTSDELMREQIIRPLIDMNFRDKKKEPLYPFFYMPSLLEDDPEPKAKVIKMLVEAGVVLPSEPWIRDYTNLPSGMAVADQEREPGKPPRINPKSQPSQGNATTQQDVRESTRGAKDDAKKQIIDKNKEIACVNPKEIKQTAKRYFIEQFVEGMNERSNPEAQGNPKWAEIMAALEMQGVEVMPLPNVPVPLEIYERVIGVAEQYAELFAGAYKAQLELDGNKLRSKRRFKRMDREQQEAEFEKMAENAIDRAKLDMYCEKFGAQFRGGFPPSFDDESGGD